MGKNKSSRKSAFGKNIIRTIINNKRRYAAILAITALGVSFYAGLRSTSPDMNISLDHYFNEQDMFDIRIMTNYGLGEDDIISLSETDNISLSASAYYMDEFAHLGDSSYLVRIHSLSNSSSINMPVLIDGRLPEKPDECVVYERFLSMSGCTIGDKVVLSTGNADDIAGDFKYSEFTITGTILSPLYLSKTLGSTTKGNGNLDSFFYVLEEAFVSDVYTEAYFTLKETEGVSRFSDEYDEIIDKYKDILDVKADEIANTRKAEIIDEATIKINDAKQELEDGKQKLADSEKELKDGEAEIADAEKALAENRLKYEDGVKELEESLNEYNEEIAKAEELLDEADKELTENEQLIKEGKQKLTDGKAEIENQKNELISSVALAMNGLVPSESITIDFIRTLILLENPALSPEMKQNLSEALLMIDGAEQNIAVEWSNIKNAETELAKHRKEYETSLSELNSKKLEADAEFAKVRNELDDANIKLLDGEKLLNEAKAELSEGFDEYYKEKAKADIEIAEAEAEIADFEKELSELAEAKAYVLGINENIGFVSFKQDSERIDSISKVFPAIFFLVAALVSLTNMLRIVEDDRSNIGILKALGYRRTAIFRKYLVYALSVSIPGGILGIAVGYKLFPYLIYNYGYHILYTMDTFLTPMDFGICALSLLIAFASVILPTIAISYKEMLESPAQLMRPKAPKPGKRVILEKMPFIWRRMSFFTKVTVRNILRYKKRFFMTVTGIAGCTALIVTGFGLYDSIKSIPEKQFGELFVYDFEIDLKENITDDERNGLQQYLDDSNYVNGYTSLANMKVETVKDDSRYDTTIYTPYELNEFGSFIKLRDNKKHNEFYLGEQDVVITQKLSYLLKLGIGDTINIEGSDKNTYELNISGITENYVAHNIYMSKELFSIVFGKEPDFRVILGSLTSGIDESEEELLSEQLLKLSSINGLSFTSKAKDFYTDMIKSLSFVVIVLIIAAGMLAFVVLISLTGINIDERARELATLKVLGFFDNETAKYILRENIVLTVAGTAAGLLLGIAMHRYVILTAEPDLIMFGRQVSAFSFTIAAALTFVFSWLVTFIMSRSINKIDMLESLKSVE